jgi:FkbM family methyltransferase
MTVDARLALRPGTWDPLIADAVFGAEYGPIDVQGCVVVDVGAHIGAFSVFAAARGARRVLAYEPGDENFRLLAINAMGHPAIETHRAAVWRSDRHGATVDWRASTNPKNTGGGTVIACRAIAGTPVDRAPRLAVEAVAFDAIVERVGVVGLLKIDAEGSEYPILATSRRLDRVEAIVGEYHAVEQPDASMRVPDLDEWSGEALMSLLEERGFEVATRHLGGVGVFRARRR